jgi:hypothetical protein
MKWIFTTLVSLALCSCYSSLPQHGGDGASDPGPDGLGDDGHISETVPVDPPWEPPPDYPWDPYTDPPPDVCPPGFVLCSGVCVDTLSDPRNCGGCGLMCPDGSICSGGTCIPWDPCEGVICAAPFICCYGACVDITSDPYNCGGCGLFCPWGSGDPGLDMQGCLDPSLGVYNLCCYGTCRPVGMTACGDCAMRCGSGSTCTGLWDASTGMCSRFVCMAPLGSTGDPCTSAEDCSALPDTQRECLTSFFGYSFPGGYCTAGCSSSAECGPGADCVDLYFTTYCFKRCTGDDQCRSAEGYSCSEMPYIGGGPYCIPL